MQHEEFREWLILLVYRELDSNQEEQLQKHVQTCEPCRDELKELRTMLSLLDELDQVPEGLLLEVRSDLRARLPIAASYRWAFPARSWWSIPMAAARRAVLFLFHESFDPEFSEACGKGTTTAVERTSLSSKGTYYRCSEPR